MNVPRMKLIQLQQEQFDSWDEFVAGHPDGTIYHTTSWKSTMEQAYPHIHGYIIVAKEDGSENIAAGMPVYHVRSWLLGNRLITVPHATWCDPLASNEMQQQQLLDEVCRLGRELSAARVEVKCRASSQLPPPENWVQQKRWKHHVISLDKGTEALWKLLSLNSVRQLVKRAQKKNVVTTIEHGEAPMKQFYSALIETRKRLKLPMLPYRYFSTMLRTLPRDATTVHIARTNNRVLGAALTLTANRRCHLELTGEYPDARTYGAMQSLIWTAVQHAATRECREFSFGRTDQDNDGLLRYKRGWATLEEDLSLLQAGPTSGAPRSGKMARVESMLRTFNQFAPRPIYRLIGSALYRHWG